MRENAERMNGQAKGLSDRNTCFICDADERGSGLEEKLEENVRLCSPMFAYVRLMGKKFVEALPRAETHKPRKGDEQRQAPPKCGMPVLHSGRTAEGGRIVANRAGPGPIAVRSLFRPLPQERG